MRKGQPAAAGAYFLFASRGGSVVGGGRSHPGPSERQVGMEMSTVSVPWDVAELGRWVIRHSDAWHSGSREDCDHCQEMIRWFGPMPPAHLIRRYASGAYPSRDRAKHIIPSDVRWAVWERDNFTCQHCGSRRDLTIDHVIAESKGGANEKSNYQTLCRRCNSAKGTK